MTMKLPGVAVLIVVSLAMAAPAAGQNLQTQIIIDRLNLIERDLADLKRQFYRGDVPPSDRPAPLAPPAESSQATLQHEQRIARLEEEIRTLTGMIEETRHDVRRTGERVDKLVADIDFRLGAIESRLAGGASVAATAPEREEDFAAADATESPRRLVENEDDGSPLPMGVLGTIPAEEDEPVRETARAAPAQPAPRAGASAQEQYDYAFALLRNRDFAGAEAALEAFLDQHGDSDLASNAFYWLGETHYVRNDLEQAAITFAHGYQASPDGSKAPDILLKLGVTLNQLGNQSDACATLDKLASDYPNAPTTIRDRAARERSEAGCT